MWISGRFYFYGFIYLGLVVPSGIVNRRILGTYFHPLECEITCCRYCDYCVRLNPV